MSKNRLLNKYIGYYTKEINPEFKNNKYNENYIQDYNGLIKEINCWYTKKLKNEEKKEIKELEEVEEKIFYEKSILKSKMNNCVKNEIVTELSFGCSFIIPLFVLLLDKILGGDVISNNPNIILYSIIAFAIYSIIIVSYSISSNSNTIKHKAFYILCIDILEKMEKEIQGKKLKIENEKEKLDKIKTLFESVDKTYNEAAITKEDKLKCIEYSVEEIKRFIGIK